MNAGQLKVNFGGLDVAAADITSGANALEARLAQLESELAPLRADWTGAASESYQVAQAKWNAAINDMKLLLADIGKAVSLSNTDYQTAESRNASRWG